MNVCVKKNVYCLCVWNVLSDEIGLSGHYTLVIDRRNDDTVYFSKHGDYAGLISYVPETNPLKLATDTEKAFFMNSRVLNRLENNYNPPLDFDDTFASLRAIYADREFLIDSVLAGNV